MKRLFCECRTCEFTGLVTCEAGVELEEINCPLCFNDNHRLVPMQQREATADDKAEGELIVRLVDVEQFLNQKAN
jgi:hypothetical protein